jgi:hypothetical protein
MLYTLYGSIIYIYIYIILFYKKFVRHKIKKTLTGTQTETARREQKKKYNKMRIIENYFIKWLFVDR